MRNNCNLIISVIGALLIPVAHAEGVAKTLTQIGEDTMVIEAKTARERARKALISQQKENEQLATPSAADPTIEAIEALGSDAVATLRMPNGSTMEVRKSDVLPGGSKVTHIARNAVAISDSKGRQTRLMWTGSIALTPADAGGAQQPQQQSPAQLAPAMPPGAPANPTPSAQTR